MIAGTSIEPRGSNAVWAARLRGDAGRHANAPLSTTIAEYPGGAVMNLASTAADLILHNGRLTTLDRSNPTATAVAIQEGKFVVSVGTRM